MAHDIVRVYSGLSRFGIAAIGSAQAHAYTGAVRKAYHVDTGKAVSGAITEGGAAASNTRVALINARTLAAVDVVRALGNTYLFRSVADDEAGYFVLGLDLDGNYKPVCEGPVFPVAQ